MQKYHDEPKQYKGYLKSALEDERDLRGTGAYRYIQTMAGRAAARKKQAGAQQTIREALEAQGGVRWYAPKATPHRHRIWLRKAFNRDFRFACPRWPLYTPEGRPAPETLVRHSIVPLQRPSAQPVVTCGRLEALCSRHFSDTAPHVGHFFANRTALPVPRVSLPAPAAPRSAATCRRTAAGLDVLPPAGASRTWHASRAGPRSSPAAAGDS